MPLSLSSVKVDSGSVRDAFTQKVALSGIPECDCVWFLGCRRSDTAIPASSTARWARMVKFDIRAVWEGVVDTSEESFLHQLVGSWRASIRCLGALNLVAGLTESDHARLSGKGTDGCGIVISGSPEPVFLFDSAELRLASRVKYRTGVHAALVHPLVKTRSVSTRWRTHQHLVDPHGHVWTQGTSSCVALLEDVGGTPEESALRHGEC